jgi:oligopeptide transport system ATP-binding protein
MNVQPVLSVRGLDTRFATGDGVVHAVDHVSFDLMAGEVLGIVGESGSGKSVTALSVMKLVVCPPGQVSAGEITLDGEDILHIDEAQARRIRGSRIAMIFQDPMKSLNPVLTIGPHQTEVIAEHLGLDSQASRQRAIELLSAVGIPRAETRLGDYPHQFSGGMRQRVMIAIALSCDPRVLIADEATTALDVTIQAQIIDLVKRLADERDTAVIWISHDLGVVAGICDRVAVMYAGRIVEMGTVRDLFHRPSHGYTLGLLASTPRLDDAEDRRLQPIDGMPPNLTGPMSLCPFLPRCVHAIDTCHEKPPEWRQVADGHGTRCWADLGRYWRDGDP